MRGGDVMRAVAFSPDGSRLARAEGCLLVVCDARTGFVESTLRGHSKDDPECTCKYKYEIYEANADCPVTGHSDSYVFFSSSFSPSVSLSVSVDLCPDLLQFQCLLCGVEP